MICFLVLDFWFIFECVVALQAVIGHDVDEEDRKHTWEEDANSFVQQGVRCFNELFDKNLLST